MNERGAFPLSADQILQRVNKINDPVKRAGASAFASVYSPVLHSPKSYTTEQRQNQRDFAVQVKQNVIDSLNYQPEQISLTISDIEQFAQQNNVKGIDMLLLSERTTAVLRRTGINLEKLDTMTQAELMDLRNMGKLGVKLITEGMEVLKTSSIDQLKERIEAYRNRPAYTPPDVRLLEIPEVRDALKKVGRKVSDDVRLIDLIHGDVREYWGETDAEFRDEHRGVDPPKEWFVILESDGKVRRVLNIMLGSAIENGYVHVSDIRHIKKQELRAAGNRLYGEGVAPAGLYSLLTRSRSRSKAA